MIPAALRASARGLYPDEAACELLINHASWLHRRDFTGRFLHTGVSIADGAQMASIDWPAAITALDSGELRAPAARERCSAWRQASEKASR